MGYVAIISRKRAFHEALSRQSSSLYNYDHELKRGKKNRDLKFDLILNTSNIAKSQEGIVVTADIEEDTIDVRVENDDEEMIEFDKVAV